MLRATTACTFSTSQLPKVVRSWCVLYLLTWKCASHHNGVQLFISHLPRCLRTRRFSEPTLQPSGAFSRTCIFFLLIFSLLTLLPADCFFISPYCRKFDFQTSFDHYIVKLVPSLYYVICNISPTIFISQSNSLSSGTLATRQTIDIYIYIYLI